MQPLKKAKQRKNKMIVKKVSSHIELRELTINDLISELARHNRNIEVLDAKKQRLEYIANELQNHLTERLSTLKMYRPNVVIAPIEFDDTDD